MKKQTLTEGKPARENQNSNALKSAGKTVKTYTFRTRKKMQIIKCHAMKTKRQILSQRKHGPRLVISVRKKAVLLQPFQDMHETGKLFPCKSVIPADPVAYQLMQFEGFFS